MMPCLKLCALKFITSCYTHGIELCTKKKDTAEKLYILEVNSIVTHKNPKSSGYTSSNAARLIAYEDARARRMKHQNETKTQCNDEHPVLVLANLSAKIIRDK